MQKDIIWKSLVFVLLASVPAAHAQTPVSVGEAFDVSTSSGGYPQVASAADGTFLVVWHDFSGSNGDPSGTSIQGRRFDADGEPISPQFLVNTYTTGAQERPWVAVSPTGESVVVWDSLQSGNGDSSLHSIQGQRFASNGEALGAQFRVNTYTTNQQRWAAVASDSTGDFVVVWHSDGSVGTDSSPFSIQGQRFASGGSFVGGQFQVNTYTTSIQRIPAVSKASDGSFVVVWTGYGSKSENRVIHGRRYASNGEATTDEFMVNSIPASSGERPQIATAPNDSFVATWHGDGSGNGDTAGSSIQARLLSSSSDPLGAQFLVNTYTTSSQNLASVAIDTDGSMIIVWESFGSENGDSFPRSIQGQRLTSNGSPIGDQFLVNQATFGQQVRPSVAFLRPGEFVVVWTDLGFGGHVDGRRFLVGPGNPIFGDGFESGDTVAWSDEMP